jgi:hypothetical protein
MKETACDRAKRKPVTRKVLGITVVALLVLVSVVAAVDGVAAADNNKVVKLTGGVTLHIVNKVGNDIIVAWTKAGTTDRVFKVSVSKGKTSTLTVPTGKFEQYVKVKQGSIFYPYQVITNPKITQLKSGYEYTLIYLWASNGNLKSIPASKATKIFN